MKRAGDDTTAVVKRAKQEDSQMILKEGPRRTSNLKEPVMLLSGHGGIVYSSRFSPSGATLATSSFDSTILLWNVYDDCDNFHMFKGHRGAVLEIDWSRDGTTIVSASSDKTGAIWDVETGERVRKLRGHSAIMNGCGASRRTPHLFATAGDDGTVKMWDSRVKIPVESFSNTYQVTSVCFNDSDDQIISGGIDNIIKVWDIRKKAVLFNLKGHTDTITGLKVSPDGSYLLSNGMDQALRMWDIKPFAPENRLVKVFQGHTHGNEKQLIRCGWSPDGSKVVSGSSDRTVMVWDVSTQKILFKLPGHKGTVLDVDFHPKEPILASCGADKQVFLGEI